MESNRGGEPFDWDNLSEQDRRALTTLERSASSAGLRGLWRRVEFRLVGVWGTRLAIWGGLVVSLATLAVMWAEVSSHLAVAVGSEFGLTAGVLLFAYGLRLRWHRGRATKALHR